MFASYTLPAVYSLLFDVGEKLNRLSSSPFNELSSDASTEIWSLIFEERRHAYCRVLKPPPPKLDVCIMYVTGHGFVAIRRGRKTEQAIFISFQRAFQRCINRDLVTDIQGATACLRSSTETTPSKTGCLHHIRYRPWIRCYSTYEKN